MRRGNVKTLLIYPPITDPTSGYHSLSYLEAYAQKHGHTAVSILDANIEAIDYMAQPAQVEELLRFATSVYQELGSRDQLNGEEQIAFYYAWMAKSLDPGRVVEAFRIMRDCKEFYNYPSYYRAAQAILLWIRCLSLLGMPGQFAEGFALEPHGRFNLNSSADLTNWQVIERANGPFLRYYQDVLLPNLRASDYQLIGLNITYLYQLPFALWLLRCLKETMTNAYVIVGGTEVSDLWKYSLHPERFQDVFAYADACIVGEGESTFLHVLNCLSEEKPIQPATNLILNRKYDQEEGLLPFKVDYEELETIPTPNYDQLPWAKYLSPEPFVYYSPSRGCYWNKCTFCDYGLNFGSPTSPWRADSVDKITDDLRTISKYARFVYFSVDVLAPATLLKLADRIVAEGIVIRWSAEIRLEAYWSKERCELLKHSGCVAISVGFESGNQRVLDLIDKGTTPQRIAETIKNFAAVGIGVQMMGFTGFPTETDTEALDSVDFLREHRDYWTFGGLGNFVLTPGAIVAREPGRFGITDARPFAGEDIARHWFYRDPITEALQVAKPNSEKQLRVAKNSINRAPFPRPFLGGVDTPHTLMYHDWYGTGILQVTDITVPIDLVTADTRFILNGQIRSDEHGFGPDRLLRHAGELYREPGKEGRALSYHQITDLLENMSVTKEHTKDLYFVRWDGGFQRLTKPLTRLLEAISTKGRWADVLEHLKVSRDQEAFYLSLLGFAMQFRLVISFSAEGAAP